MNKTEKLNRRDFLKNSFRYLLGAVLAGLYFFLFRRSDINNKNHTCINTVPQCRSCSKNSNCILPQALSFRKVTSENKKVRQP